MAAPTEAPSGMTSAEHRAAARAAFFSTPNKPLRPILTFINGDNCWLVSIPIPAAERASDSSGRFYFHLLLDPWLGGQAIYRSTWLLSYTQTKGAEIASVKAIGDEIREIEAAAAKAKGQAAGAETGDDSSEDVDAILISDIEAPDHLNKETLLTFRASVPIYIETLRANEVEVWGHFETVVKVESLNKTNTLSAETPLSSYHPGGPLPKWLTFLKLDGPILPMFSSVIVFEAPCEPCTETGGQVCHEMLLYSPHSPGGVAHEPLANLLASQWPPVRHLALMMPLMKASTGGVVTQPGGAKAMEVERLMRPKYWVPTADAGLNQKYVYGGAISWVLSQQDYTIDQAMAEEEALGIEDEKPNFLVVDNGGCLVLDC